MTDLVSRAASGAGAFVTRCAGGWLCKGYGEHPEFATRCTKLRSLTVIPRVGGVRRLRSRTCDEHLSARSCPGANGSGGAGSSLGDPSSIIGIADAELETHAPRVISGLRCCQLSSAWCVRTTAARVTGGQRRARALTWPTCEGMQPVQRVP